MSLLSRFGKVISEADGMIVRRIGDVANEDATRVMDRVGFLMDKYPKVALRRLDIVGENLTDTQAFHAWGQFGESSVKSLKNSKAFGEAGDAQFWGDEPRMWMRPTRIKEQAIEVRNQRDVAIGSGFMPWFAGNPRDPNEMIDYITTHEIGHLAHYSSLAKVPTNPKYNPDLNRAFSAISSTLFAAKRGGLESSKDLISSEYGQKNIYEHVAEAFAAGEMGYSPRLMGFAEAMANPLETPAELVEQATSSAWGKHWMTKAGWNQNLEKIPKEVKRLSSARVGLPTRSKSLKRVNNLRKNMGFQNMT